MRRWRNFLFTFLLILPFASKVSLRAVGAPESFSFFWLQAGMHPLVNSVLAALLLGLLMFQPGRPFLRARGMSEKVYGSFLIMTVLLLWGLSLLQMTFLDVEATKPMQIGALILTTLLVWGYGWALPQFRDLRRLFEVVTWATRVLLLLSFVFLILRPDVAFKGSRFIGIFKHIPYMVTCGQLSLLVEWQNLVLFKDARRRWAIGFLVLALISLVLTGTRSAALCGLLFLAIAAWKWPVFNESMKWTRRGVAYLAVIFGVTLGPFAYAGLKSLMTGETSFGLRTAQDGIASRMEEIERGLEIYNESPHLGHGLLHRFASDSLEKAGSYNSFKDPHNLFISAGVIGGWPFLVWIFLGFIVLAVYLLRKLSFRVKTVADYQLILLSAYLFSHLPILFVYHMHLSLGGLADRMYWLILGFVCCLQMSEEKPQPTVAGKELR